MAVQRSSSVSALVEPSASHNPASSSGIAALKAGVNMEVDGWKGEEKGSAMMLRVHSIAIAFIASCEVSRQENTGGRLHNRKRAARNVAAAPASCGLQSCGHAKVLYRLLSNFESVSVAGWGSPPATSSSLPFVSVSVFELELEFDLECVLTSPLRAMDVRRGMRKATGLLASTTPPCIAATIASTPAALHQRSQDKRASASPRVECCAGREAGKTRGAETAMSTFTELGKIENRLDNRAIA